MTNIHYSTTKAALAKLKASQVAVGRQQALAVRRDRDEFDCHRHNLLGMRDCGLNAAAWSPGSSASYDVQVVVAHNQQSALILPHP
jgi:hypothetical protein